MHGRWFLLERPAGVTSWDLDAIKRLAEQTGMDWFGQRLYYKVRRSAELMLVFDDSKPPPLVASSSDEDQ